MVAAAVAGMLAIAGAGLGAPADQGNCISTRDNGGAAGARVSSSAGPGFGPAVADAIGAGVLGSTARGAECRR
jgi:hypothetical protein